MKRFILLGWILSVIGGCSDSENGTNPHLPLNVEYSVESLQEDYTQLVRVIEKNHPALYDFSTKKEYKRLLKIQYEKISDSLTIADFYKVVTPVLSEIGCGHSTLRLPEWVWSDSATTLLPLKLFFEGKKGHVIVNYTSHDIPGGAEILSINGTTIPKILERIEYRIPTDGDNISTKRELLNYFFNELFAIQEGFPDSYDISFRPAKTNSIQ